LLNGSALAVNWAKDHVPAIVEAWYPGQAAGTALADVLFGDYNPAGRLPVTFYKSADQLPPFIDYSMKGRTYRYFTGEPLFPFGFGLSYTTFTYRNLSLPKQATAGEDVKVAAEVENSGKRAGEEVVEVYVKTPAKDGPIHALAAFQRISLQPGERKRVEFTLAPRQLSSVLPNGQRMVEPGMFEVSVGGTQPGPGVSGIVTGRVPVGGPAKRVD
jgi:beta-glucosidase